MVGLISNGGSFDLLQRMVSMTEGIWGFGVILENVHGIQEQNYAALLPGNEMSVWFYYRNLILGV